MLSLYARPGIEGACLAVQQRLGVDVVVMLWCAWAGAKCATALDDATLTRAGQVSTNWHMEVVRPLRALRIKLKSGPRPAPSAATESLRQQLKAAEQDAERLGLEALCAAIPLSERSGGSVDLAITNMQALIALPLSEADKATLNLIATAAAQ